MGHPNTNIADILQKTATEQRQPESNTPKPEPKPQRQPSRAGKKPFTIHLDEDAHTQLKIMAIEQKTSMHDIVINALNVQFELNNKPPIA